MYARAPSGAHVYISFVGEGEGEGEGESTFIVADCCLATFFVAKVCARAPSGAHIYIYIYIYPVPVPVPGLA